MGPLIVLIERRILLARWLDRVKPAGKGGRWGDDDDEPDDDYDPFEDDDLDEALAHRDLSKLEEPDRKD